MFDSILVVCVGNICRSPVGERLLQRHFSSKVVTSAGIRAVVGSPAHHMSNEIAGKHGLSLAGHVSRQLTSEMCLNNDLILVMEKKHINEVAKISPLVRGKIMLFGHWLEQMEIADPYGRSQESYEIAYDLLDKSAKTWLKALSS